MRNFSITQDTEISSSETDEVRAANSTSTKNRKPTMAPPGMEWNAAGRVWNIRVGPASGCSPTLNTMGKMARPAMMATEVSAKAMMALVDPMLVSRDA